MTKFMIETVYDNGSGTSTVEAETAAEALAEYVTDLEASYAEEPWAFEGNYDIRVEVWTPQPLLPEQHPDTPPLHHRTLTRNCHVEARDGKVVVITAGEHELCG
jgi:hypothetical protein